MDKDITITKTTIDKVRNWFAHALGVAAWLIVLGLIAGGLGLVVGGGLFWLAFGSEAMLALGFLAGAMLAVVGIVALVQRLDRCSRVLRS